MNAETSLQRITGITGRRPSECQCSDCQAQCKTPCLGTPHDIERLIDAGYVSELSPTLWLVGMLAGIVSQPIPMIQAIQNPSGCIFFSGGLCKLHKAHLKPTEGKLSYHTLQRDNYEIEKSLSWNVAKEWINPANFETINRIVDKYKRAHNRP